MLILIVAKDYTDGGFYILDIKSNIFDLPVPSSDKYYIFGISKNFDKTFKKIINFFNEKGYLIKNDSDTLQPHASFYKKYSFSKNSLSDNFFNYVEKKLGIKIYTDEFYEVTDNVYTFQSLRIGDFDDAISGKILSSYESNLHYIKYNCYIHYKPRFQNDWRNNPYAEFEKEGRNSRGSAEHQIHYRRKLKECTYLYIVGPENAEEGIHNFKVGIAKDLNARIIFYQSHSPNKVKLYFYQSCFDGRFSINRNAEQYEMSIHSRIRKAIGMIHQDWCRISLENLLEIVKKKLKENNQPLYRVVKYGPSGDIYVPIRYGAMGFHICIDDRNFILSKLTNRTGYPDDREKRKIKIKKFKDIKSLYEYFYENFKKLNEQS